MTPGDLAELDDPLAAALAAEVDRCRNMGGPLGQDPRDRLLAALRQPSPATWDAAHTIIVQVEPRCITVWQAVQAVVASDRWPSPAAYAWRNLPDRPTLLRALQWAHGQHARWMAENAE
jgi:hypothetical protein